MAILQVKNVPDDLYAAVKARASDEHMTVSDLVLRGLRREVGRPTVASWLAEIADARDGQLPRDIDTQRVMDEVRAELG